MHSALIFILGFFIGVIFTLACGFYLSTQLEDPKNGGM